MAKIEIFWTEEAETWLRDIYDFIAQDNSGAAANVVNGVYQKAQLLRDFPEIGYIYREEKDGEIRILLYGHYRIAYMYKTEKRIDILGIFHGALDIERYFT